MSADDAKLALSELGGAWRGDWSEFDGRTLRGQLQAVVSVLDGEMTLANFRVTNDLCPAGGGHWAEYCDADCRQRSPSDAGSGG